MQSYRSCVVVTNCILWGSLTEKEKERQRTYTWFLGGRCGCCSVWVHLLVCVCVLLVVEKIKGGGVSEMDETKRRATVAYSPFKSCFHAFVQRFPTGK